MGTPLTQQRKYVLVVLFAFPLGSLLVTPMLRRAEYAPTGGENELNGFRRGFVGQPYIVVACSLWTGARREVSHAHLRGDKTCVLLLLRRGGGGQSRHELRRASKPGDGKAVALKYSPTDQQGRFFTVLILWGRLITHRTTREQHGKVQQ